MVITTKIIEEMSVTVPSSEERQAVAFLTNLGFSIINFVHQEEWTKVTGQRAFEQRRKK